MTNNLTDILHQYIGIEGFYRFLQDRRVQSFLRKYAPSPAFRFKSEINQMDEILSEYPAKSFDLANQEVEFRILELLLQLIEFVKNAEHNSLEVTSGVELQELLIKIKRALRELLRTAPSRLEKRDNFNSEKYYQEHLRKLKAERDNLHGQLSFLESQSNREQSKLTKTLEALKEKELLITQYEYAEEERKKKEDEQQVWENKIKTSFETLKKSLEPLSQERSRLKCAYFIYSLATVAVFLGLFLVEYNIYSVVKSSTAPMEWANLLPYSFPVPVLGALLWGFITQINRIQRQLTVLARHIHEIEYIEGLILAINNISMNQERAIERVNNAIDRLMANHFHISRQDCLYDEDRIKREEKKDPQPTQILQSILSEIRGFSKD